MNIQISFQRAKLLSEGHLAVVPGNAFGAKNHLRLSYACSMKELQKAVERLKRGLKKLEAGY